MKKTLYLFLLFYALINKTNAQSNLFFEHANFEIWDSSQGYLNPANWFSLNELTVFGLPTTLERTTDAHSGKFAVMLTSKDYQGGSLSGVLSSGPLLDAQGNPDLNTIKVPYTYRPTRFQFYYHADPEPGDSGVIAFVLTKWNLANQKSDTIGLALAAFSDSTGAYSFADLEIKYKSPLTPDSVYIIASSSADGYNPTAGSKLFLDDFTVVGGSNGLKNLTSLQEPINVYPNPASNNVVIKNNQKESLISIYNMEGKCLFTSKSESAATSIDVGNWNRGVYIIEIKGSNGEVMHKKLFVN